jgi:hypothetical protein
MRIISDKIALSEITRMADAMFGNFVKAVVDVEREVIAVDAELHSDLEAALLDEGAKQRDLWGINLYPSMPVEEWIEFDSMINVRPSQGNGSRGVEQEGTRRKITAIVAKRVVR